MISKINDTILSNLESNLGNDIFVVYNEEEYIAIYIGILESYTDTNIKLLIKNKFHDKLQFYEGSTKKIMHIYNDSLFDLINNKHEFPLSKCVINIETAKKIVSILKKSFNKKLIAVRFVDGGVTLVKGKLVEISANTIKLQTSYYQKEVIPYDELLHLYNNSFQELLKVNCI